MKRSTSWLGIVAAATLALSLGACSDKAEETAAEEEVEEVTQSEEQSAEELEAEEPEEEAEGWTISESQGVGPARVDAGYVSFEVGDGVEWWMTMHAENSHYAAIKFGPDRSTELEVMPTKDESMEDMVEYMTRKLEAFDEPPEDLGEVTINGLVYHEWARTAPSGKVFLHLATYYEPMGARV